MNDVYEYMCDVSYVSLCVWCIYMCVVSGMVYVWGIWRICVCVVYMYGMRIHVCDLCVVSGVDVCGIDVWYV